MTTDDLQVAHDELIALLDSVSPEAVSELERRLREGEVNGAFYYDVETDCGCVYGTVALAIGIGSDIRSRYEREFHIIKWCEEKTDHAGDWYAPHTALEDMVYDTLRPGEVTDTGRQLLTWIASWRESKVTG